MADAPIRVIARTVGAGRVGFNQVVMEQNAAPAGVMLVAIDPDEGLHVWLRPNHAFDGHTIPQARGYSSTIPPFVIDDPPEYLGDAVFIDKDNVPGFESLLELQTNALNHAIREIFGVSS
jgi:hypothetical protein